MLVSMERPRERRKKRGGERESFLVAIAVEEINQDLYATAILQRSSSPMAILRTDGD